MPEQIKIAELNIDTGELLNSLKSTKKAIQDLKDAQKVMKITGDQNSESFIKNEASLKTLTAEYGRNLKVLQANTTTNQKLTLELTKEVKSIDDAVANNKELRKVRNQLNASTEEGAKKIAEINKKIDANTDFVKDNTSELEQQKMNIGNYKSALEGVVPQIGVFNSAVQTGKGFLSVFSGAWRTATDGLKKGITQIRTAASSTTALSGAQRVSAVSSNVLSGALKVLKFALIATGIGAIVVVLGSLVGMLTNTQKGADKVSQVMKGLGAAVSVVVDRISDFGGAVTKFFSGDFTGGFNDMKEALKGVGDEMAREATLAYELEGAFNAIRDAEINLITTNSKRRQQIAQAKLDSKDETKSLEDRVAALDRANQLEAEVLESEKKILAEKIRISNQELALGESSREEIEENARLRASLDDLDTQSLTRQKEIVSERNGLINQVSAKQKAAHDAEVKRLEDRDKAQQEAEEKEKQRLLNFMEVKRTLEEEAELARIEDELEKEELRLEQKYEAAQRELEADLENMVYTAEEKRELEFLLEEQRQTELADLRAQHAEKKLEKDKSDAEKELAARTAAHDAIVQAEKDKAQAVAGIASKLNGILSSLLGDSIGAQIAAIAIETGIQAISVKSAAAASNAKNLAQATAALPPPLNVPLIATAIGQNIGTTAAAAASIGKIVGGGALNALGAVAKGLKSNGQSKQEKFAQGGILSGPSHAYGGIKTPYGELEGGEAVINKRSSSMFGGLLSAINEAGGGKKFDKGGVLGGTATSRSFIDYDLLAAKVAEANMSLPAPRVGVDEIAAVAGRVDVIETQSRF